MVIRSIWPTWMRLQIFRKAITGNTGRILPTALCIKIDLYQIMTFNFDHNLLSYAAAKVRQR